MVIQIPAMMIQITNMAIQNTTTSDHLDLTPNPSLPEKYNNLEKKCFLGHVQKDACRKTIEFGGTKTSRSLTTTLLVTKTMNTTTPEIPASGPTPPALSNFS